MPSPSVSFEVFGMNELSSRITELGTKGNRIRNDALREAANPVEDEMKRRASGEDGGPKIRTGRGRESIKVGRISTLHGYKTISIGIHKEDHDKGLHMYYQEFGTSRSAPRPFIRKAFEEKESEAFEIIRNSLKKGLGL